MDVGTYHSPLNLCDGTGQKESKRVRWADEANLRSGCTTTCATLTPENQTGASAAPSSSATQPSSAGTLTGRNGSATQAQITLAACSRPTSSDSSPHVTINVEAKREDSTSEEEEYADLLDQIVEWDVDDAQQHEPARRIRWWATKPWQFSVINPTK